MVVRCDAAGEDKEAYCYICSPYRGNFFKRIRNRRYAGELTRRAIKEGYIPITPHLYLPRVLDDQILKERKKGIRLGQALLDTCGTILIGTRYGISSGMDGEIKKAVDNRMRIRYWR